jgi:hypothetical protein
MDFESFVDRAKSDFCGVNSILNIEFYLKIQPRLFI